MNNPRKAGKTIRFVWWSLGTVVLAGAVPTAILAFHALNAMSGSSATSPAGSNALWWLLASCAVWAAAVVMAIHATRYYMRRLREAGSVVARVAAGEHSARLEAQGPENLARFYQELNSMLDSLSGKMRVYESILGYCAGCAVAATDANGAIAVWNKGAALLLGGPDLKSRRLSQYLVNGESVWREASAACLEQGVAILEASVSREGTIAVPVEMTVTPRHNADGKAEGYVVLMNDMSRANTREADLAMYAEKLRSMVENRSDELLKKNAELEQTNRNMLRLHEQMEFQHRQLKVAHEFLDNVLRTVPTAVITVNTEKVITSFNEAAERITGFGAAEIIGQKCTVLRGSPCLEGKCGLFDQGLTEPPSGRKCTITTRDGRKTTVIKNVSHLKDSEGRIIGGVESFIDVTQLEEAERKLRETDERLQKILACAADVAIITMDRDWVLTSFNEGAGRLSGWKPSEAIGKKAREIFASAEETPARAADIIARIKSEGRYEGYVNFLHKNGESVRVYLTLMSLANAEGEMYGYVGVSRAESASKDYVSTAERISHEIVMTMPDPCLMLDDNGVVSCANDAAGRLLSAQSGAEWKPVFDSADEWWSGEALRRMLKGKHSHPVSFEAMLGQRFYEITLTPVTDPNAVGALIVTGRDVTESAALKRQLVQQDKMVTVGMLTAGVAHEFNNLLGGMLGYASLAKSDPGYREKLVEVVENQGQKAVEIAQGLINYSRRDVRGSETADVRNVIEEVLALVARDMEKHGVKVLRDYQPVPPVLMNVGQIEQVLLNLFVNARQAIGKEGVITVGTRHERDNVLVTVSDTGCGIRHEDRQKIFQPFYTTKRATDGRAEGTGLGLSVSYNIIKQHRGSIRVASEIGKGSTFTVALPVANEGLGAQPAQRPDTAQQAAPPRRKRRIMVVDDEAVLRSLFSEILSTAGHEVVCVDSGRKAVELLDAAEFDLIFLDITLGGDWDGTRTFDEIKQRNKTLKIILSTGSVEHAHIQPYIKRADAFLQKPFTMNDLLPLVEKL